MTTIINHDLRCVDGKTVIMPPYAGGLDGWGNLALPNIHQKDENPQYPYGTKFVTDERCFFYGKNAHTSYLTANRGVWCDNKVDEYAVAPASHAVGATYVTHTVQEATIDANEYAGGYLAMVWAATAAEWGPLYKIISNTAGTVGNTISVYTENPLVAGATGVTAVTAGDSYFSLYKSMWKKLYTGHYLSYAWGKVSFLGVTSIMVTALYSFWLQTWGPAFMCGYADYPGQDKARQYKFWIDGAIVLEADSAITAAGGHGQQNAGFLVANYIDATNDPATLMYLQVCR